MESIDGRIDAIARDRRHGSTFLTMEAVRTLAAATYASPDEANWVGYLGEVAGRLADAKPAMAAIRNATGRLLHELVQIGPKDGGRGASDRAERLLSELGAAAEQAADNAASLVPESATLLTCSYSSAVTRVCLRVCETAGTLRVLVFDVVARPESPGGRLALELAESGIATEVVALSDLEEAIRSADLALVGADAVTPLHIVNGAPSLKLARATRERAPIHVVCETVKFASDVSTEPGYDRVPLTLVSSIITELGGISSDQVAERADLTWR